MDEVFINQEADPYVLEADGTLDVAVLQLQPATVVINGKKGLVDVQNSKTKRTFAEIQEKILRDATAGSMANPLQISGASLAGGRLSYFISPQAQAMVRAAVFYIMDEDNNGVGVGVFFSKSKAVTADHNLTVSQGVGTQVVVQIPGLHEQLTMAVSARDTEMDYAILQSSTDHAYLPVYADPPEQLVGTDLVLAGYRIGTEEYAPMFSRKLGFTKADAITLSNHNNHLLFRCTTFAGDSGAALILKDGCLVGIHQEAVNALRERLQHAKVVKDRLSEVEQSIDALVSGGTAQGCCALLSSVFAK